MLYSGIITLIAEYFLVRNLLTVADYEREFQTEEMLGGIADFRLTSVLLFVLFGICLFSLVFWILQRSSFVYISKVSETMRAVSAGDLNAEIEVSGDDEFAEIAEMLIAMTAYMQA